MGLLIKILTTVGIISSFLIQTQGADKYTDGNRPYEFGFNIEGEQHRHEKKDEKGLIMGEFGFITADGVYHVTVYATDEQGRFKILSMKNIRVKPYPTYKQTTGSARQGHSLDLQTPQQTLLPDSSTTTQKTETSGISGKSCSSCRLPTTTTQAPAIPVFVPNVQNVPPGSSRNPQYPQGAKTNSVAPGQQIFNTPNLAATPSFAVNQPNIFNSPQQGSTLPNTLDRELVAPKQDSPIDPNISKPNRPTFSLGSAIPNFAEQNSPQDYPSSLQSPADAINQDTRKSQPQGFSPAAPEQKGTMSGRSGKKYDGDLQQAFGSPGSQQNGIQSPGQENPKKPTLISAQMQIVDGNTDIYKRGPGEKEGLPDGLTKDDMTQLLYTFNYTVGFHGHFEEGYRNGAKQGYYYVTGRNGVRTRIDYVADEKGFRPKISQEVLDLISEDVPKEETEKDEKYGLKGYEFKWLYYPVESKGQ